MPFEVNIHHIQLACCVPSNRINHTPLHQQRDDATRGGEGHGVVWRHSFSLCRHPSLVTYPKGLHCIFRLITLLEEIGQLLPERDAGKAQFVRCVSFQRLWLTGNMDLAGAIVTWFQTHLKPGIFLKDFTFPACWRKWRIIVTFFATYRVADANIIRIDTSCGCFAP